MWSSGYYFFIILVILFLALFQVTNLTTFAVYSELFWLNIYVLTALSGSFVNSPELFSVPFIILVLTAVEAVIIWTFIISNNFKNN
jgi:hypothetical protein